MECLRCEHVDVASATTLSRGTIGQTLIEIELNIIRNSSTIHTNNIFVSNDIYAKNLKPLYSQDTVRVYAKLLIFGENYDLSKHYG